MLCKRIHIGYKDTQRQKMKGQKNVVHENGDKKMVQESKYGCAYIRKKKVNKSKTIFKTKNIIL